MKINKAPNKPTLKFSDIKVGQGFAFTVNADGDFEKNGIFVRLNDTEELNNCVEINTGKLEYFSTDSFSEYRLVQVDEVTVLS